MRVTVYGANGFTGSLIAERLIAAGYSPRLATRLSHSEEAWSAAGCSYVEKAVFDLASSVDRKSLLESTDILIQAAGPYASLPLEWYADLSQWRGCYLDLCGESDWVKNLLEKYATSVALASGLWLPACAFESAFALGLVDLLRMQRPWSAAEPVHVKTFYQHEQPRLSPGTKATARLSRGVSHAIWSRHQWQKPTPLETHWERTPDTHAVLSPLPEVPLLALDPGIASCASYLILPAQEAALFMALQNAPVVEKARKSKVIPSLDERQAHTFTVTAEVERIALPGRITATLRGCDPYGLTAEWVVATVRALVAHGENRPVGIRSPVDGLQLSSVFSEFIREHNLDLSMTDSSASDTGGALAI